MNDYQRARYALEAEQYAQQAADQVERIIIDAIHGRYDDLWLLVPCPVARQAIAASNDRLEADLADLADAERVIRRLIALLDAHGIRWQT